MSHGCGIVSRDVINVRLGCVLFWVVKRCHLETLEFWVFL